MNGSSSRDLGSRGMRGHSRREFVKASASAAVLASARPKFSLLYGLNSASDDALQGRLAADPLRPQFHLLPAKNWMNDPNGPIYFNGHYHLFFQYNPLAAMWGNMSWNHAVSDDMLHWKHLPVAFTPTPGGPDSFGCFSGSAIAVGTRVYMVYTGAAIPDGSNKAQESQCL